MEFVTKEGFEGVRQTERESTRLGSLPAIRLVIRYLDKSNSAMLEELVLAMRKPEVENSVGIVYTIGARFSNSRRRAVEALLGQFVASFQLQPFGSARQCETSPFKG